MINQNRRSFLKTQMALGACMAAGLDVISAPAKAADVGGYRALVCVYLAGGNDSTNMFVPRNTDAYKGYAKARQHLAIPYDALHEVQPESYSTDEPFGFHPAMPELAQLFNDDKLAVVANVGTLAAPITQQQYLSQDAAIPRHLFSHNSQTDSWLSSDAYGLSNTGWAGRMLDVIYRGKELPKTSPSFTVGGKSIWQTGSHSRAFEVGLNSVAGQFLPNHQGEAVTLRDTFRRMHRIAAQRDHRLIREYAQTLDRAEEYVNIVNDALSSGQSLENSFTGGRLAAQLKMVARLISVRSQLVSSTERQVFFVRLGGFDTHKSQASDTSVNGTHAALLQQVDTALAAFQREMEVMGVSKSVTTFTATEFGRTLTPNSSGTDHGWGGHNLVMGGAVNGGDIYGKMPVVASKSVDTINLGRFIPTTSVDQYSATLARWFGGLDETELKAVFPNLGAFETEENSFNSDLGFMA